MMAFRRFSCSVSIKQFRLPRSLLLCHGKCMYVKNISFSLTCRHKEFPISTNPYRVRVMVRISYKSTESLWREIGRRSARLVQVIPDWSHSVCHCQHINWAVRIDSTYLLSATRICPWTGEIHQLYRGSLHHHRQIFLMPSFLADDT